MNSSRIVIRQLVFTGPNVEPIGLDFESGLNLIYGASNTGKSFALESLDFMLGGSKKLANIKERKGYKTVWLEFSILGVGNFTLSRSIDGGGYKLYDGIVKSHQSTQKPRTLSAKHNAKKENNLSLFLLKHLGLAGKLVAKNANGVTHNLSIRDMTNILLVDETSIQSKRSPIEGGQIQSRPKEHSVFRLLLSGIDDSSITPIDADNFQFSKNARLKMINEMIADIELKLSKEYPYIENYPAKNKDLENRIVHVQKYINVVQEPISKLVGEKQRILTSAPRISTRLEEVQSHINRFIQLENVYKSDIERLIALEEAGFILSLKNNLDCPLCGASVEAQKRSHSLDIEQMRNASIKEVKKIERQQSELGETIDNLKTEKKHLENTLSQIEEKMKLVDQEIEQLSPKMIELNNELSEIIIQRDEVKQGLNLLRQRNEYYSIRENLDNLKKPYNADKPDLSVPRNEIHEFCKVVRDVLKQWDFPGECDVNFDDENYDLIIDGQRRIDNGKGVRAVTHAAFKVALLLYCRKYNLPHPGFVVLDTPLLTYRDPLKNSKFGALEEDEKVLAKSAVKKRFFEHLASIDNLGQFIVFENVDPPENLGNIANVQLFSGKGGDDRNGLFPNID